MTRDEIIKGIDKGFLNKQRIALLDLIIFLEDDEEIEYVTEKGNYLMIDKDIIYSNRKEHAYLFNGLLNLLDLIQDNIELKQG